MIHLTDILRPRSPARAIFFFSFCRLSKSRAIYTNGKSSPAFYYPGSTRILRPCLAPKPGGAFLAARLTVLLGRSRCR